MTAISILKKGITYLSIASFILMLVVVAYYFSPLIKGIGEGTYCRYSDIDFGSLFCGDSISGFIVNKFNPLIFVLDVIFIVYVIAASKEPLHLDDFFSKNFAIIIGREIFDLLICLVIFYGGFLVFKSAKNYFCHRKGNA